MRQYKSIVGHVLRNGVRKSNRTGTDTRSIFNVNYEVDLREGFPLITTKEVSWKNIVMENLWFLSGDPRTTFLEKHECSFWKPWTDPETKRVPSSYGYFWRNFDSIFPIDQLRMVLEELKVNHDSRRLVVSAWNPENALYSTLPPCHYTFCLNVQSGFLNLHLTQRSCDVALGLPYNISGYAFLLELFARFSGLDAGTFAHSIVDCHIYENHVEGLREQLTRPLRALPKLSIDPGIRDLKDLEIMWKTDMSTEDIMKNFVLTGYDPHPPIKFKVAV